LIDGLHHRHDAHSDSTQPDGLVSNFSVAVMSNFSLSAVQ
jgi:hypothetical protein